jgi:CRISPR/Cas system-associated endonuclease Cas3-HD
MAEYTDMTDEEYDALDEELTRTVPKLGPNGTGFLSQKEMRFFGLTNITVNYLLSKAMADHKSPAQLINELVIKEMAAAV